MAKRPLKNFFLYRIHDGALEKLASRFLKGRLLDIGCGIKPYKEMLAPYIDSHVGVDHEDCIHNQSNIDLLGTAYEIPSEDNAFDSAVCTAVLEHLEEPEQALRECHRVLKPGGYALYSVPFIWHLHEEPRDFYRFSKYGLRYLFEKTGFEIIEMNALSGFWFTFGQLFVYNMYRINYGPLKWLKIIDATGLLVQSSAYVLDRVDKTERWTWMYMVVARKKG